MESAHVEIPMSKSLFHKIIISQAGSPSNRVYRSLKHAHIVLYGTPLATLQFPSIRTGDGERASLYRDPRSLKLVHLSSCALYGKFGGGPQQRAPSLQSNAIVAPGEA
jgi:hypothetical protein